MYNEKLMALYERRGVRPPTLPEKFTARIPDNDIDIDHDPDYRTGDGDTVENLAFWIKYQASDGKISERDILIKTVKHASKGLVVSAICYKRDMLRTFRADRILEMYWIDTGEIVESPFKFLEALCHHPNLAIKRHSNALMILAFLSRCDGNMHRTEIEVMADYIEEQSLEKLDRTETIHQIRAIYPCDSETQKAIQSIKYWPPEERRGLGNAMRRLIDADGIIHPSEFDEVLKISEELKAT